MSYLVNDRRGENKIGEVCRCCGAPVVHTREYNHPTMDCIKYLRSQISKLESEKQDERNQAHI